MAKTYKSYDDEFKKNIVKLIENGKPIADISREYGLHRSVLYDWKKKFETITTGAPGTDAAATITGTSPNFVLNLTIPQGPTGPAA